MINIKEPRNVYAQKLLRAFTQFRKIHWKPPHVKDLKPSEFMVLHAVKHSFLESENGLMVSDISKFLKIARPTVTQLVNSLQRKGFLDKCADEHDKRVVRINLSEKGKNLAKQGADEFYKRFEGLAEYIGDKKSLELANLLQEVFEYFKETEPTKG